VPVSAIDFPPHLSTRAPVSSAVLKISPVPRISLAAEGFHLHLDLIAFLVFSLPGPDCLAALMIFVRSIKGFGLEFRFLCPFSSFLQLSPQGPVLPLFLLVVFSGQNSSSSRHFSSAVIGLRFVVSSACFAISPLPAISSARCVQLAHNQSVGLLLQVAVLASNAVQSIWFFDLVKIIVGGSRAKDSSFFLVLVVLLWWFFCHAHQMFVEICVRIWVASRINFACHNLARGFVCIVCLLLLCFRGS
jgi:hypothetical protein